MFTCLIYLNGGLRVMKKQLLFLALALTNAPSYAMFNWDTVKNRTHSFFSQHNGYKIAGAAGIAASSALAMYGMKNKNSAAVFGSTVLAGYTLALTNVPVHAMLNWNTVKNKAHSFLLHNNNKVKVTMASLALAIGTAFDFNKPAAVARAQRILNFSIEFATSKPLKLLEENGLQYSAGILGAFIPSNLTPDSYLTYSQCYEKEEFLPYLTLVKELENNLALCSKEEKLKYAALITKITAWRQNLQDLSSNHKILSKAAKAIVKLTHQNTRTMSGTCLSESFKESFRKANQLKQELEQFNNSNVALCSAINSLKENLNNCTNLTSAIERIESITKFLVAENNGKFLKRKECCSILNQSFYVSTERNDNACSISLLNFITSSDTVLKPKDMLEQILNNDKSIILQSCQLIIEHYENFKVCKELYTELCKEKEVKEIIDEYNQFEMWCKIARCLENILFRYKDAIEAIHLMRENGAAFGAENLQAIREKLKNADRFLTLYSPATDIELAIRDILKKEITRLLTGKNR